MDFGSWVGSLVVREKIERVKGTKESHRNWARIEKPAVN
jgi:hypothetical protein